MRLKTQYGIKEFRERNHGDHQSSDYIVRVSRGLGDECVVDFEYVDAERTDTQCGGIIALEPEAARWLAFALLGTAEKYTEPGKELTACVENGVVSNTDISVTEPSR